MKKMRRLMTTTATKATRPTMSPTRLEASPENTETEHKTPAQLQSFRTYILLQRPTLLYPCNSSLQDSLDRQVATVLYLFYIQDC